MIPITPPPVAAAEVPEPRLHRPRPISNHLKISRCEFRIVNHSFTRLRKAGSEQETETETMSAPRPKTVETIAVPEPSCRDTAPHALAIVRDGVITGEGPTTRGRVHFSRALDADDAALCARILTAHAVADLPVSRAEAEALFEINDAATERSDNGRFDDLLAKAVAHHAASVSGLPVPPRNVALSPDTDIESWAPVNA